MLIPCLARRWRWGRWSHRLNHLVAACTKLLKQRKKWMRGPRWRCEEPARSMTPVYPQGHGAGQGRQASGKYIMEHERSWLEGFVERAKQARVFKQTCGPHLPRKSLQAWYEQEILVQEILEKATGLGFLLPQGRWDDIGVHIWQLKASLTSGILDAPCSIGNTSSNGGFSIVMLVFGAYTPPKFKSSPLKSYLPNRKGLPSNHHFSGASP